MYNTFYVCKFCWYTFSTFHFITFELHLDLNYSTIFNVWFMSSIKVQQTVRVRFPVQLPVQSCRFHSQRLKHGRCEDPTRRTVRTSRPSDQTLRGQRSTLTSCTATSEEDRRSQRRQLSVSREAGSKTSDFCVQASVKWTVTRVQTLSGLGFRPVKRWYEQTWKSHFIGFSSLLPHLLKTNQYFTVTSFHPK